MKRLEADGGSFYMLDLGTGTYVPFFPRARTKPAEDSARVAVEGLTIPPGRIATLQHFLGATPSGDSRDGLVVYAFRGRSCLGALRIDGPQLAKLDDGLRDDLLASANLLSSVYETEFAFNLLTQIQTPVDFRSSEGEFFGLIAEVIKASSRMEFAALREHVDGRLKCIALAGFGDDPDLSKWDLDPERDHSSFFRALAGETVPVESTRGPEFEALHARTWSTSISSFVTTPVRVGEEIFGVLSVAARCEFEYAPVELRGFESIANGVGVSITNFRNSRRIGAQISEYTEVAMAVTAVEVARAAKHEAIGYIGMCNRGLRSIWERLGRPEHDVDVDSIDTAMSRLQVALNKITTAPTTLPAREFAETSLKQICTEALTAVVGRLEEERIDVHGPTGPDVKVYAWPDWLRQVFLNLLLNSTDAFREANKSGRRIDIAIDPRAARSREIVLTYRDNATGINPARLQGTKAYESLPLQQMVFQEGVTSKRGGSGFGLWLVRHILEDHHASIDLTSHRGGVTFVLRFPSAEEGKAKMEEGT